MLRYCQTLSFLFCYKVLQAFMFAWQWLMYLYFYRDLRPCVFLSETVCKDWTVLFGAKPGLWWLGGSYACIQNFLQKKLYFPHTIPSISPSSLVFPACSCFCIIDAFLPKKILCRVQLKRMNTCCHKISDDLPLFGSLVLKESK